MITLKKLSSLTTGTQLRKIARILREFEASTSANQTIDVNYLSGVMEILSVTLPEVVDNEVSAEAVPRDIRRICNTTRHRVLRHLGLEPADWDMYNPEDEIMRSEWTLPISLYLDDLRSPFNVGSIFRTSAAMGVRKIYLSPDTPTPDHQRVLRSSMGAAAIIPWQVAHALPENETVVALETGGVAINEFPFPAHATLVVGSEELGVSPNKLRQAQASGGVVSIPLTGSKVSLNVGVSVGILMQHWTHHLQQSEM